MPPRLRTLGVRAVPLAGAAALSIAVYTMYAKPTRLDAVTVLATSPPLPNPATVTQAAVAKLAPLGVASPLTPLGWGSNAYLTLLPADANTPVVKNPTPLPQLGHTPLRDLVVQEKYGACIDARGDLWMWGKGYDESGEVGRSLRGKKLQVLAAGPGKLFGLSRDGRLFVVSADRTLQHDGKATRGWWKKLTTRDPIVNFAELHTRDGQPFQWGECWAGVAVGQHHLLAVTNLGRTFSLPLTPAGNSHRQLGTGRSEDTVAAGPIPPASDPHFATKLTEIPALSGIEIAQVAASDRSSFVRTHDGRVLGFGANEAGQIGLGATSTVAIVPTPVEIALSRAYPSGSVVQCTGIVAGAQTTFFRVARTLPGTTVPLTDLLACGNGQSGALGTAMWSSASYAPSRVKALSGLEEYSEKEQALIPLQLYSMSVSPSPNTHVFAVLDTLRQADTKGVKEGLFGKDVLVWGGSADYQLGTGKRSSVATPQHLPSLIPRAIDTLVAESKATEAEGSSDLPGPRLQLHQNKADAYDLEGKLIKRGVKAEETIVAGWNCSILYNKIVS